MLSLDNQHIREIEAGCAHINHEFASLGARRRDESDSHLPIWRKLAANESLQKTPDE